MKKQSVTRAYNFPDADLYLQCMERIQYARRDISGFKSYGYTLQKLKGFENLCTKLSKLPSDDELIGTQMVATTKKSEGAEKLKTAIRSVMTRVSMKFKNRTGRYRKFGTSKMGDMTDAQLLFCGRRVVRVARAQLDFLAETGLSEKQILRVQEACKVFENAMNIQQDKVSERDIFVEKRVELGNKMYQELLTISNIGKDLWAESNRAKYENYVLYESNNDQKIARKQKMKEEDKS